MSHDSRTFEFVEGIRYRLELLLQYGDGDGEDIWYSRRRKALRLCRVVEAARRRMSEAGKGRSAAAVAVVHDLREVKGGWEVTFLLANTKDLHTERVEIE